MTERLIWTLKREWLRRVLVIRGMDHFGQLLDEFSQYYNHWWGHSTIGGAVPSVIHRGIGGSGLTAPRKPSLGTLTGGSSQTRGLPPSGWQRDVRPASRAVNKGRLCQPAVDRGRC